MHRDLDKLTARTFDLLVVGGGIYGLTIACDAAKRGLDVALIERDDFGCGSSFNHLRTIHGGLRYLQTLDLLRARESARERRTLARIAPHALRPLRVAVPLSSFARQRQAGDARRFSHRSDGGSRPKRRRGSVAAPPRAAASCRAARPSTGHSGMRRQGLTGAAIWFDYVTTESDRLTFSWALAAADAGAVLANHVEAVSPIADGRRVTGVRAVDRMTGHGIEIGARLTVNAAGAGVEPFLAPLGISARIPLLKAMNLVTNREAGDDAIGGRSRSGRNLFLVPWRGRALFGTWESPRLSEANDTGINEGGCRRFHCRAQ